MRVIRSKADVKVLIACEYSGVVRDAFIAEGFDAMSCDLLPSAVPSNRHIQADVRSVLDWGWDLMAVMHPPCTRLCNSGVRWLKKPPTRIDRSDYTAEEIAAYAEMDRDERLDFMWRKLDEGAALFSDLWNAPIKRVAVENPVMHKYAKERIRNYREFSQSVQPWQFGHPEIKRTCFWLRDLPTLIPTDVVEGRRARVHMASKGPDRWMERSKFFPGMARAMAQQWGYAAYHELLKEAA